MIKLKTIVAGVCFCLTAATVLPVCAQTVTLSGKLKMATLALNKFQAAMVVIDLRNGEKFSFHPELCSAALSPCSTFKIVNTLCALENGVVESENTVLPWDGLVRPYAVWNRNLTLKEAFAVSAVPHFQYVAARIGAPNMQKFLSKISYGNADISGGITQFWLGCSLLISTEQQADFLLRLLNGQVSVSQHSMNVLRTVAFQMDGQHGRLFGKTGTLMDSSGRPCMGWYVGWTEDGNRPIAVFALNIRGNAQSDGNNAKALAISLLQNMDLL